MPILRQFMTPTAGTPIPVVAPGRRRNMNMPNFYSSNNMFPGREPNVPEYQSQQYQPDQSAVQDFQTTQSTVERRQAPQFEDTNYTQDYLSQQLQNFANRAAPPQLDPGARVRSPNAELVQPSNFKGFYDQLDTVGQISEQMLGAANARAAYKKMQELQAVQAQQVAAFGGPGGMPVGYKNPNAPYYQGEPAGRAGSGLGLPGQIGSGLNLGGGGGGTPAGNFRIAQNMAKQFGWGPAEINAWYTLGMKESGWRNTAQNPTSTAYGIGQFLDSTWGGYGIPKTSDPSKQILAMARYIKARYGSPSRALSFHYAHNWY